MLDRGIVAYTARAKIDELGVDEAVLEDPGPVSQPVTRQMAKGARARADVDWAASVTGIAGPTGGTEATPVGTVFVGVAGRSGATVERYEFEGDRWSTKQRAAEQVIDDLLAGIQV